MDAKVIGIEFPQLAACCGWNMFVTQMEELQLGSLAARPAKSGG